jgi:hypothetical protein
LQQAIFPSQWKRANVSPVFKNNKPNEVKKLQSSIFDCAAKKILNSIAFSISSKIRLSFFIRGGIP